MKQPRRAGLDKIRRKTAGGLAIDRPIAEQRAAFARLMALTEVGMPAHRCGELTIAGVPCLRIEPEQAPTESTEPTERGPAPTIVFVHGGGYSLGSPATHRPLAARIARRSGATMLLPDYRLAPEHPCPAGLDDLLALWRRLPEALPGTAPHDLVLAGDSAGGGLALALAMALRDRGEPAPAGLVLLSPWTDLTMSGASIDALAEHEIMLRRPGLEFMAGRYAGALDRRDCRVSPLFGRFEGLPPMLIQVGGHEVLRDDATRAATRGEQAGVAVTLEIWEGQCHVFQATPLIEAAGQAITAIGAWVRAMVGAAAAC